MECLIFKFIVGAGERKVVCCELFQLSDLQTIEFFFDHF